ncbi:hypothetical protein FGO68_gene11067 [Halteria grandinella]|uniref:Uncharacterized protein n=1 Tax=Halteria grandinella TaxID=5974 RepID=A0A8J8NC05_HALGN|nr:hypothetical protein FGO68_gene11067 [Halteria grandinella]
MTRNEQINGRRIFGDCSRSGIMPLWQTTQSSEYCFSVFFIPFSQFFQYMHLWRRDCTIFSRTNIKQQITPVRNSIYKNRNHLRRRFVIGIIRMIAPVIICGHTQFPPVKFRAGYREILFRSFVITIALQTAIDNYIRIITKQQRSYRR